MIKELTLKNFKSLRDITISLGPFNVFVGPNDSGKSSIQEALSLLTKTTRTPLAECFPPPRTIDKILFAGTDTKEVYLGFKTRDMEYSLLLYGNEPHVKEENLRVSPRAIFTRKPQHDVFPFSQSTTARCPSNSTIINEFKDKAEKDREELKQLEKYLAGVKIYNLKPTELAKDSYLEPSEENLANPQLDMNGYGLPSLLTILATTSPDDERYSNIKKYLRKAIPYVANFGVSPIPVATKDAGKVTGQSLYFELKNKKKHKVPAALMSDGVLLILGYLTLMYSTKELTVLFIEEPENGIHPKLLPFIVDLLRSISSGIEGIPPVQIILTTHSPYLVDHIEPEEGFIFLKDDDGATNIAPMKEIQDINKWCEDHLLGEVWFNLGEKELVGKAKK